MNLGLLDPFGQTYPEKIEAVLKPLAPAVTCAFNRWGTMLATGLADGTCVVWDFDTKGVSRELVGHVRTISSVSWSCSGRRLLTSSADKRCIVWDLLLQDGLPRPGAKTELQFDAPVGQALMHPRRNFQFVACAKESLPVLVELTARPDGHLDEKRTVISCVALNSEGEEVLTKDAKGGAASAPTYIPCFDRRGDYLILGDQRGIVSVVNVKNLELVSAHRISTGPVRTIKFSPARKRSVGKFLTNVQDRGNHKIKVFAMENFLDRERQLVPSALYEFQEVVNRSAWMQALFSSDGEFVVAGSAAPGEHKIYIWDSSVGNLIKILDGEGPRESLVDLSWHPIRPMIASVGSFGNIFIWSIKYQENWSAYAPDFKELEENVEYEEREDEFDAIPASEASRRTDTEHDATVDVETIEGMALFNGNELSDDEEQTEEPNLLFLPTLLEDSVLPKIAVDNNTVAATLIASRPHPQDAVTIDHEKEGNQAKRHKMGEGEPQA